MRHCSPIPEFHSTPKHGSWLNMVEGELSVLADQCVNRRLPATATVQKESAAWEWQRKEAKAIVLWCFTTEKARTKRQLLYPPQPCGDVLLPCSPCNHLPIFAILFRMPSIIFNPA
jgi:hypothetical protein